MDEATLATWYALTGRVVHTVVRSFEEAMAEFRVAAEMAGREIGLFVSAMHRSADVEWRAYWYRAPGGWWEE